MSSKPMWAASRGEWHFTEPELVAWGENFGAGCGVPSGGNASSTARRESLVVSLEGDLGAGKTTLVQAICRGFGVTEDVTSPTFAIVHRYNSGPAPVHHIDLYRLRGPSDLTNLGWDDIIAEPGLVLVEWPDRAGNLLQPTVRIRLSHDVERADVRTLQMEPA